MAKDTTSTPFQTKYQRWSAMLAFYQARPGAIAANNATAGNGLRTIMVKLLCAINGTAYGHKM
jgi:hypothetical protein